MDNTTPSTQANTTSARALSRRDLLTHTALVGTGLALAPMAWAATPKSKG